MRKALGREIVLARGRQERKKQRQEQSGRRKRIEPGTCGYLTYTRCCRALPRPTMKAGGKQNRTYLVCVCMWTGTAIFAATFSLDYGSRDQ